MFRSKEYISGVIEEVIDELVKDAESLSGSYKMQKKRQRPAYKHLLVQRDLGQKGHPQLKKRSGKLPGCGQLPSLSNKGPACGVLSIANAAIRFKEVSDTQIASMFTGVISQAQRSGSVIGFYFVYSVMILFLSSKRNKGADALG